jgi:hypothetical protein
MLLRRVCRSLRLSIDAAIVPVASSDEGHGSYAGRADGGIDVRPRATLSSLLQLCCSPHLVMHSHSYGPDKSFAPLFPTPSTLVGAPLSDLRGCARGSMSVGQPLLSLAPLPCQVAAVVACVCFAAHKLSLGIALQGRITPCTPLVAHVMVSHPLFIKTFQPYVSLSSTAIPLGNRSNDCGQIGSAPPSPPLLTPLPLPLPLPCLQVHHSRFLALSCSHPIFHTPLSGRMRRMPQRRPHV